MFPYSRESLFNSVAATLILLFNFTFSYCGLIPDCYQEYFHLNQFATNEVCGCKLFKHVFFFWGGEMELTMNL